MKIRTHFVEDAEPYACLSNARARVEAVGGSVVFGWIVKDAGNGWRVRESHAVWQTPEGELLDVTPIVVGASGDRVLLGWPPSSEFERDDAAAFDDRAHPNVYVPPGNEPALQRAAAYMNMADLFMNQGDLERCRYWTEKANQIVRKRGYCWDVPQSLAFKDVFKTTREC